MHVYILRILMLGTVLFGSTYFFMVMFQCRPISTFWDENPRAPGKCWNDRIVLIMTYTAAAINCLADWAFGILPIFIVWSLNLPLKSKILVMLILGFAAIGSTATIVRIFFRKQQPCIQSVQAHHKSQRQTSRVLDPFSFDGSLWCGLFSS